MNTVVNLRDYRVGRRYLIPPTMRRIDRATEYGNPYSHLPNTKAQYRVETRAQAIYMFERYAYGKLHFEPDWLEPLRGFDLACWCRPPEGFNGRLLCHGQVIVSLLDGVAAASVG